MSELNPNHIESLLGLINKSPFFRHMSIKVTELGVGFATVMTEIDTNHMNPFGAIHGGVYASAIDTAAYWSAYCDLPEDVGLVTIDLKVDFLAPFSEKKLIINGNRIKSGKTLYLAEAEMTDENGRILAHGTSKLMVTPGMQTIDDVINYISADKLPSKFLRS